MRALFNSILKLSLLLGITLSSQAFASDYSVFDCLADGKEKLNWNPNYDKWTEFCEIAVNSNVGKEMISCVEYGKDNLNWNSAYADHVSNCTYASILKYETEFTGCLQKGYDFGWNPAHKKWTLFCYQEADKDWMDGFLSCMKEGKDRLDWDTTDDGNIALCKRQAGAPE